MRTALLGYALVTIGFLMGFFISGAFALGKRADLEAENDYLWDRVRSLSAPSSDS